MTTHGKADKSKGRYEKIKHLGEGQFANVYKAKDTLKGEIVAIKKIKIGSRAEAKDGVNRTALREIKLLQELHHDNIIGLLDVIGHKTNIQLVFDFMETDLEHVVKDDGIILMPGHIKNMTLQMLLGLEYLHLHWILHRDLKPNNLLMNDRGRIKIADFGLARFFGSPNHSYTHQVVTRHFECLTQTCLPDMAQSGWHSFCINIWRTEYSAKVRWYRAPELLLGARYYGTGVDIWAIGCIIAELLLRVAIFRGESDLDQLVKICQIMGTPTDNEWPGMSKLPDYVGVKPMPGMPLKSVFTAAADDLIQLLASCLDFDPMKRCTCTEALKSAYFIREPYPCEDSELPLPGKGIGALKRRRDERDDRSPPVMRKRLAF